MPLNPPVRRPFYVIAHNPNELAEVAAYLDAGANGMNGTVRHCGRPKISYLGSGHQHLSPHPPAPPVPP